MVQKFKFDSNTDIPDLSGKVIIVTGGNSGLGKESILQLSKHNPSKIYMAARSQTKAEQAIADVKTTVPKANIIFLQIELSSLKSVKKAAETVLADNDRLDILLNNAGLMGVPSGLTEDGYEVTWGTNYMGPTLFTRLLLPLLQKTADLPDSDVRIVNLSSMAIKHGAKEGLHLAQNKTDLANLSDNSKYAQSKLGNLYFTQSISKRYPDIKSVAIHPGVVRTGIMNNITDGYPWLSWLFKLLFKLFMVDVHEGAIPQLFAATGGKLEVKSGAFYFPGVKEAEESALISNTKLAEELWDWTEAEFESKGY